MALSRRSGRSRFTLVLLVLTSITLLTLDFRGFTPIERARSVVLSAFAPVGDAAQSVFKPVTNFWNGAFDYDRVERENEALRAQVDELRGQVTSGDVARQSLQQLLEQADIEFVGDLPRVTAQVRSGSVSNFEETLELDKGEAAGIKVGMPVVTGRGLIGRVVLVSGNRSVVELVTSGNFAVGFSVVGTGTLGVARGTGGTNETLRGTVDAARDVQPGQILVTSGLQGSVFPRNLPLGVVANVSQQEGSLQKDLDIDLLADLSDLTFATVLLWEPTP